MTVGRDEINSGQYEVVSVHSVFLAPAIVEALLLPGQVRLRISKGEGQNQTKGEESTAEDDEHLESSLRQ